MAVELNTDEFNRACADLGLPGLPSNTVYLLNGTCARDPRVRGQWQPHAITVFLGHPDFKRAGRPLLLATDLTRTILHELRHEWQYRNKANLEDGKQRPGLYWESRHEQDARDFADLNAAKYRLVRVRNPSTPSRGLSRLSAAAARAKGV